MNWKILTLLSILLLISACDFFENGDTQNISRTEISIKNLPSIPESMIYVGWFVNDNIDPLTNKKYIPYRLFVKELQSDNSVSFQSELPLKVLQEAQYFLLTAEYDSVANDSGLTPGAIRIMKGSLVQGNADLSIGEQVFKFNNPEKVFFTLSTPTDGNNTNEVSGVWFIDSLDAGGPRAGLILPELYTGWIYEGWVEINDSILISTGKFSNPSSPDEINRFGSTGSGYTFPGEDFLINAPLGLTFPTDLSNAKVYVSIEYNNGLSFSEAPFIKILSATIPANAQSGIAYSLQLTNDVIPNGIVKISVDILE
jgi:hypothetical protein